MRKTAGNKGKSPPRIPRAHARPQSGAGRRRLNVPRVILAVLVLLLLLILGSGLAMKAALGRYGTPREIEKLAARYLPNHRLRLERFHIDLVGNIVVRGLRIDFPDGTPIARLGRASVWMNPWRVWKIARGEEAGIPDNINFSDARLFLSEKLFEKAPETSPPQKEPPAQAPATPMPPPRKAPGFNRAIVSFKNIELYKYINKASSKLMARQGRGWLRLSPRGSVDFSVSFSGVKSGHAHAGGTWAQDPGSLDARLRIDRLMKEDLAPFIPKAGAFPIEGAAGARLKVKGALPFPEMEGDVKSDDLTVSGASLKKGRADISIRGTLDRPDISLKAEITEVLASDISFKSTRAEIKASGIPDSMSISGRVDVGAARKKEGEVKGLSLSFAGKGKASDPAVDGTISMKEASFGEIRAGSVRIPFHYARRELALRPSSVTLLGDTVRIEGTGSFRGSRPAVGLQLRFGSIDLGDPRLKSLNLPIKGKAYGSVALTFKDGKLTASGDAGIPSGKMEGIQGSVGLRLRFLQDGETLRIRSGTLALPWGSLAMEGAVHGGKNLALTISSKMLNVKMGNPPFVLSGGRLSAHLSGPVSLTTFRVHGNADLLTVQDLSLRRVALQLTAVKSEKMLHVKPSTFMIGGAPLHISGDLNLTGDKAMRLTLEAGLSTIASIIGPGLSNLKGRARLLIRSVPGAGLSGDLLLTSLEVSGERFDRGDVSVKNAGSRTEFSGSVLKNGGKIQVRGLLDGNRINVNFASSTLSSGQIPFRQKSFPQLEGKLVFSGTVTGTQDAPFIKISASLSSCKWERRHLTSISGSASGTSREMKVPGIRLLEASPEISFRGSIFPEKQTLLLRAKVNGNSLSSMAAMFGHGMPPGLTGDFLGTVSLSGLLTDIAAVLDGKLRNIAFAGHRLGEGEMKLKTTKERLEGRIYLSGEAVSVTFPSRIPGVKARPFIRLSGNPRNPTASLDFEQEGGGPVQLPKLPDLKDLEKIFRLTP
jgi:autotransporter translocation and assembly factor TamB